MRYVILACLVCVCAVSAWAQAPVYGRGTSVRLRPTSPQSQPQTTLPLMVVATPGDQITVRDAVVLINGTALSGFSPDFVARLARSPRTPQAVPADHYVVAGEQRTNQDVSEYWGVHPGSDLESIR